ncbi:lipid A deacylase LpxR family protein [Wenyingzhuangia sp. IMCC45467]
MNFNKLFFLLFTSMYMCITNTIAQTKHETGLINDNDLYVSFYLDEYYTNGLELFYKKVSNTNNTIFNKKIRQFTLGQNIYNPQDSDMPLVRFQERPYAGYLYFNYSEHLINSKNILSLGATVGVTNTKSGAEWAQNFIHRFYDIEPSEGWETQVTEKYAVGALANYTRSLLYKENLPIDLTWTNKTVLNTVFTNISSGLAIRVNFLKSALAPISNTTFFGTALQNNNENWIKESYFGIRSFATYQIQDLTVTGELEKNPTQKQFHLEPWTWQNDFGFYWNFKHLNFSYHLIYKTRKVKEMKTKITRYGSIQISYKF